MRWPYSHEALRALGHYNSQPFSQEPIRLGAVRPLTVATGCGQTVTTLRRTKTKSTPSKKSSPATTKRLPVPLDPPIRAQLKALAKRENRSMANMALVLIQQGLDAAKNA